MPKADVRKVEQDEMIYYESFDAPHEVIIGRLKPSKHFKANCREWGTKFSNLLRQIVANLTKEREYKKPDLCQEFDISARSYNLAESFAKSMVNSANEHHKNNFETLHVNLENAQRAYARGVERKEAGKLLRQRKVKIHRIQTAIDTYPEKPSIFVGGKKHYYNQHKDENWRKAYQEARINSFGARGSKTEVCGNTTYQIRCVGTETSTLTICGLPSPVTHHIYEVRHKKEKLGTFKVCEKEAEKITTCLENSTALKVFFKKKNKDWLIYIGYKLEEMPKPKIYNGVLGVDINNGHIEATAINNKCEIIQYWSEEYDTKCGKHERSHQIYASIRKLVHWAQANNYKISLEYLDFEYCKKYLRNKLGALLHTLPYKKIRKKFERECFKNGVKLVYVKPDYTSILGNLIATKHTFLSRDNAAAMVIALRAMAGGNAYLNNLCQEARKTRLNIKNLFGQNVRINGLGVGKLDTTRNVYAIQTHTGRSLKSVMDVIGGIYYKDKSLHHIRTHWEVTLTGCQIKNITVGCRNPDANKKQSASKKIQSLNDHFTERFAK